MTSFSEANFSKKLQDLNVTQQSIQTLSLWLIHHRKHSRIIVHVWKRELAKAPVKKKLTFMYLANDVIQNSKKKGPEFNKAFATVLPAAFNIAAIDADEKSRGSMERLLNIWLERGVYSKDLVKKVKDAMYSETPVETPNSAPAETPKKKKVTISEKDNSVSEPVSKKKKREKEKDKEQYSSLLEEVDAEDVGPPPEIADLVKALSDLDNSASSDAAVRQNIADLPQEVSDISRIEKLQDKEEADMLSQKVESACQMVSEYNSRLSSELDERKKVAKMLRSYINYQRDQTDVIEKKYQDYKTQLENARSVRSQLDSHIQNLPDLSLLPSITGGLMPLPAATDLFSL